MNPLMKKYLPAVILFLCVLMLFKSNFYTFEKMPLNKHSWSQMDHYAFSLGFVENDLNFFKPQTKTYNYQYPEDWQRKQFSTITGADFPVHQYVPAVIMKIFGTESPTVNRMYLYLYSLVGVYFLFLLSQLFIRNKFLALFPVLLLIFSPVFIYYQNGFLPSIPSFSNLIIGVYLYCRSVKEDKQKLWIWAVFFLTFAVLSRPSFLFIYLSVLLIEFYRLYQAGKINAFYFKVIGGSFLVMGINTAYNFYLRQKYGAMFLAHPMNAKDFTEFLDFARSSFENWKFVYFSRMQYIVLGVLVLLALVFFKHFKKGMHTKLFVILGFLFAGSALLFFVIMEQQFINHDYYFIDCFLFPVLFIFILILSSIKAFRFDSIGYVLLMLVGIFFFRKDAKAEQEKAYATGPWDITNAANENFKNSRALLNKNNIPQDAIILCYNANPPNLPFYYMDRKGIAVLDDEYELLTTSVNWKYDYMVFQNEFFLSSVYKVYPEVINHFEVIDTDGKITLCKKRETPQQTTLDAFMQLEKYETVLHSKEGEENHWAVSERKGECGLIGKDQEFGAVYKNGTFSIDKNENLFLKFSGKLKQDELIGANLVFSIVKDGAVIYYKSFETVEMQKADQKEIDINLMLPLPNVELQNAELGVHVWNVNKAAFEYRNFEFTVYNTSKKKSL